MFEERRRRESDEASRTRFQAPEDRRELRDIDQLGLKSDFGKQHRGIGIPRTLGSATCEHSWYSRGPSNIPQAL
ncbi:hypothetical protein AVEN_17217-1 [Araneus ventricosus]|uniref:Uncharacterized protein n=1 Tax=Araneus ventricosus TaxID=182803 RepID=A0A4Y2G8Q1_ARAVE|nr:hypothetical protein AVEN_17217-1 [Araneus ventricosus]